MLEADRRTDRTRSADLTPDPTTASPLARFEALFREHERAVLAYAMRRTATPADAEDAILCDLFARGAVHAAMAGKTGLIIGLLHDKFIHVPIEMVVKEKKRLNPNGSIWQAVLAATGQPAVFE